MSNNTFVPSKDITKATFLALEERGVSILDIAEIVYEMQAPYNEGLTVQECAQSVERVLQKREIQHALLVGIELDKLAEQKKLSEPLQSIVDQDEGLFGVDETIALGAVLTYGSIAVTTFGHLDKCKTGIIHQLNEKKENCVHTFLDDLVASVAACAASRIAHRYRDEMEAAEEEEVV
ncbi:phosphatidylglycerophosphatase A [Bacillus fengqiuensis]|nr:phosphatidylglycerophosphatase A [Bacillus fengqiuensis]